MSPIQKHPASKNHLCGLYSWHPDWIQRYANTKMFMAIYGLIGTIQAMSGMYFVVTLTTLEKRFKISSQTTGIILSGNEISQMLLSMILSYIGGNRNRPRWIAWGIVFCGLSCYILALPHFIYGAGEDALKLTQEYYDDLDEGMNVTNTFSLVNSTSIKHVEHLCGSANSSHDCSDTSVLSIVPLILIFLSQFVLGIGNTLYYSLGQTYLDDNTKKKNTPIMLALAMSMRMAGPFVGFGLGYISLNMYIDPTKTPLIDNKDPRWLGAWWFGWSILGTLMVLFSGLIGMFPKELPKKTARDNYNSHIPQALGTEDLQIDEGMPLDKDITSNAALDTSYDSTTEIPKLKDFPKTFMRLLRNKLLIYNTVSAIFYLLGCSTYMTFMSKYMEIQFHKSPQDATIVIGPVSIFGMVTGLLASGIIITKKKPNASKVLMWNVIVGAIYILGPISYMFMYCADTPVTLLPDGKLNLSSQCNSNCSCDGVPYSPICHEPSTTTYFSPCHAGCRNWSSDQKLYSNCSCLAADNSSNFILSTPIFLPDLPSKSKAELPNFLKQLVTTSTFAPTLTELPTSSQIVFSTTTTPNSLFDKLSSKDGLLTRSRRSVASITNGLVPGICMEGCNTSFYIFCIAGMVINWFGSSGRVGNMLVNFRVVSIEDKSVAQGFSLMLISLFALIPGPIFMGRIIDSTCLMWTKTCSGRGNCQLYDQDTFRYVTNAVAICLCLFGTLFDALVWYHGRHLDLYSDNEVFNFEDNKRTKKTITPLLTRKD